ncbi:MATE family efflux transporter [Lutispora saccharofermentans]|uniref:Multidrug export protein MepA n=1 Tax=Lutispora saccharofermentans TaxID=3024236 RepID=A0ABT1NDN3_9FIRM|nr:MATE family efflux transporter [Lutispora saccharofermentans]MCQ1529325.1 MATE family efflux transporter [Lutispora saccharofermentans]
MKINRNIFKSENTDKLLIKFAVPTIIALLVIELYNMVDTIYVGRYLGSTAIGALAIAFPVQRLISALGLLIAVGSYTAASRYLGEKNYDDLKAVIKNSLVLTILIMSAITSLLYFLLDPIIIGLGASINILPYAKDYIGTVIFGGIFQSLTIVMCYIITALGNPRITLKATGLGAILNIILDYVLVAYYPLGVKGAAISTVLSQFISFLYAWHKFSYVKKDLNLGWKLRFNHGISSEILLVGFSTFVIEISDAVVAVLLNNLLLSYGGDKALIIIGVTTRISMFLFITVIGISSSMQPIAAFNYGADNYDKVKDVVKKAIDYVTVSSAIVWLLMMIFPQYIIGFFMADSELLIDTIRILRTIISIFPVVGVYYVAIYFYQAMGEGRGSFLLSIYRQIVVFIPLMFIMAKSMGLTGIWLSFPISDMISCLTGIYYIKRASDIVEEPEY